MASASINGRMAPGLKAGVLWSFSLAAAVLLNLVLFGLMPHLSRTSSGDRTEDIQRPRAVHFIRVRQPDPPRAGEKVRTALPARSAHPDPKHHGRRHRTAEPLLRRAAPAPEAGHPSSGARSFCSSAGIEDGLRPGAPPEGLLQRRRTRRPDNPPGPRPARISNHRQKRGIEGWVKVKFLVNESGRVDSVDVLDCSPEKIFDDAVVACVSSWRFEPGTVDGTPVNVWAETTIRFELQ